MLEAPINISEIKWYIIFVGWVQHNIINLFENVPHVTSIDSDFMSKWHVIELITMTNIKFQDCLLSMDN